MGHCCLNADGVDFYLHLEDDVQACPDWPRLIHNWLHSAMHNRSDWTALAFYSPWPGPDRSAIPLSDFFGNIGLLFRVADVQTIVNFLRRNFDEAPLDWLLVDIMTKLRGRIVAHHPSVFQHLGRRSSFAGERRRGRAADFQCPTAH
eukprot:TRINITY_DN22832_c0_g1_i1.p1 TRINITY_DN22832_c0_g1~~TRINITY_DN22832_c0_g1_i1.p1  ORF type:complete len:147 (-),score=14.87 TRINITY_DN22832_c0_g1_i1:2-442(-)